MKKLTRTLFYVLNLVVAAFAREPSCPVCSRYDYEERILERVLRNEMAVDNLLAEIRQTNADVKAAMKVMQEDNTEQATAMKSTLDDAIEGALLKLSNAMTEMKTNTSGAITLMMDKEKTVKDKLDDAIQGRLLQMSEAVSAMKTNTSVAIQQMEKLDDAIQEGLLQMSEEVSAMKTNTSVAIQQMEKENKRLKDQLVIPTIYFYARSEASSDVGNGQTVVYTAVDINEGGGYDPGTGRFTVSVAGLYSFVVQYCIKTENDVSLEIVNQIKTLQRAAFNDKGNGNACVSMQVFTKAGVSDQIWVKSTDADSQLYTDSERYNSFSGALVHL